MKLKTSFEFDAAHRLVGYEGKCSRLHGHMWHTDVEIEGKEKQLDDIGILYDFTNVKRIEKMLDHKTILKDCRQNIPLYELLIKEDKGQVILISENPTAEHLASFICAMLKSDYPKLKFKVTVWESPKSSCEVSL